MSSVQDAFTRVEWLEDLSGFRPGFPGRMAAGH
jgi:hypothetical protein